MNTNETNMPIMTPEQQGAEPIQPNPPVAPVESQNMVEQSTTNVVTEFSSPSQPVVPIAPVPTMQPIQTTNVVGNTTQEISNTGGTNQFNNFLSKLKLTGTGPIIGIAVIAIILLAGVIFAVASSSPKAVFKNAINKVYKTADYTIDGYKKYLDDYDFTKHALLVGGDFKLDSNISEFEDYNLNKISLAYNAGIDYKNEILSLGANLKGSKETVNLNAEMIDNELYIKSSLFDEILKIESEMVEELGIEVDFQELKEAYEDFQKEYNTDPETYEYIIKALRSAIEKSLSSEYMEKKSDKIEVLDKKINVTKYSYNFDEKSLQEFVKSMAEYLLEDKEFVANLAKATGSEKSDVKEMLKELKRDAKEINYEDDVAINLYTKGLFKSIAGFGLEIDGKEYFSTYTDGKNVELTIDDHVEGNYGTKYVATIEKKGKGYDIVIKENKDKLVEVNFKKFTDEVIDGKFTMYVSNQKNCVLDFYFSKKENKNKFNGEYKFKFTEIEDENYIGFSGKYTIEIKDKLEKVNTKNTISIDELDIEKIEEKIEKIAENDEVLSEIIQDTLGTIEDELVDYDINDMIPVSISEAKTLLSNEKATVLYVGNSSYYEEDTSEFLSTVKTLQSEFNFHSYSLNELYIDESFEELIKEVVYEDCPYVVPKPTNENTENEQTQTNQGETTNERVEPDLGIQPLPPCTNYPAIYLIKNGKVEKAFKRNVSYDTLKKALEDMGI